VRSCGEPAALDRWRRAGINDVHLEPHQLGNEVGNALVPVLRIAPLNDEVAALDVAEVMQTLPEGL